ncbi:unnamed protein product [Prunus brigantina]
MMMLTCLKWKRKTPVSAFTELPLSKSTVPISHEVVHTEPVEPSPAPWVNRNHPSDVVLDRIIAQVYVDDTVFGATSEKLVNNFTKLMESEFEMSMVGELTYFLGLQVKQCTDGIFICQSKYAKDLVKKFRLDNAKKARTPMCSKARINADSSGKSVDEKTYRSMIGSLLYLTASRPDIAFNVGLCARFQAKPKESHHKAVQRIIKYVNSTIDHGLWYSRQDLVEDGILKLTYCPTEHQLADLLTKPLDSPRFEFLRKSIGIGPQD